MHNMRLLRKKSTMRGFQVKRFKSGSSGSRCVDSVIGELGWSRGEAPCAVDKKPVKFGKARAAGLTVAGHPLLRARSLPKFIPYGGKIVNAAFLLVTTAWLAGADAAPAAPPPAAAPAVAPSGACGACCDT